MNLTFSSLLLLYLGQVLWASPLLTSDPSWRTAAVRSLTKGSEHPKISSRDWVHSENWRRNFNKGVDLWHKLQNKLANSQPSDASRNIPFTFVGESPDYYNENDLDFEDDPADSDYEMDEDEDTDDDEDKCHEWDGWKYTKGTYNPSSAAATGEPQKKALSNRIKRALQTINQPTDLQFTYGKAALMGHKGVLIWGMFHCDLGIMVVTQAWMIKYNGEKATDRFSDVMWTLYGHICPDSTKLKYAIVEWAANDDTKTLLQEVAAAAGHFDSNNLAAHVNDVSHWTPSDGEGKISGSNQDFYALLHAPNLIGLVFMATDYARAMGRKDIEGIAAFYSEGKDHKHNPVPHWSLIMALKPYHGS